LRGRGLDLSGSGWEQVADWCEHGNETFSSIKGGEFVNELSDY